MQNWSETILSQYADSPTITALISSLNSAIDPSTDLQNFYVNVWNVLTANGSALDNVWGPIVGVKRILAVPGGKNFGFDEATSASADPFGQSSFYQGAPVSTSYALSDEVFRALILVKALSNISGCSVSTYNRMLMTLFPNRGNAYVSSTGGMNARLTFQFPLQAYEIAILTQSGAFSAPTGVQFEIMTLNIPNQFGFAESGPLSQGFNNGIFFKNFAFVNPPPTSPIPVLDSTFILDSSALS